MFKFSWREMDLSHKFDETPKVSDDREFSKHYHNFYEIFYFVNGTAMYTVEAEKRTLQPGDALIVKPGEFHHVEFLDHSPYERYVIKLPICFMPQYVAERLARRSAFFPEQHELAEMFARFDWAAERFSEDDMYFFCGALASQIAICLCATKPHAANDENLANAEMVEVLSYINNNLEKPLTLADIAGAFHYSSDYLSRRFFQYMRTSIMKYVRTKRILNAHKLLLLGYKPTQVADMLNFSDYSTFYRSYMSVMGKAPSEDPAVKSVTVLSDDQGE